MGSMRMVLKVELDAMYSIAFWGGAVFPVVLPQPKQIKRIQKQYLIYRKIYQEGA